MSLSERFASSGKVYSKPYASEDLSDFAASIREKEVEDLALFTNCPIHDALSASIKASTLCTSVVGDTTLLALYGVIPDVSDPFSGEIWLVCRENMMGYSKDFLISCIKSLPLLLSRFTYLYNITRTNNAVSVRWLRRLGFTFYEKKIFLHNKIPFFYYYYQKNNTLFSIKKIAQFLDKNDHFTL